MPIKHTSIDAVNWPAHEIT